MNSQFRRLTYELVANANVAEKTGDLAKIAGPILGLKRLVRRMLNSFFSQEARDFKTDNYELKSLLQKLYRSFKKLEDSIDDYDLSTYKLALSDVKDQIGQLVELTHRLDSKVSDVENETKDAIEHNKQENSSPSATEPPPGSDGTEPETVVEPSSVSTPENSPEQVNQAPAQPESSASQEVSAPNYPTKQSIKGLKGAKLSDVPFLSGQPILSQSDKLYANFFRKVLPYVNKASGRPATDIVKSIFSDAMLQLVNGRIVSFKWDEFTKLETFVDFEVSSSLLVKPIIVSAVLVLQPNGNMVLKQISASGPPMKKTEAMNKLAAAEEVQKVKTTADDNQLYSAIILAWQKVFGKKPTVSQVANTFSQIGIETGHGRYILNWNVGNINWTSGNSHNYVVSSDTKTVGNDPAHRETYHPKRRAYDTLVDGVEDYLRLLATPYYKGALNVLMENGSPQDFSHALAEKGYYDPYVRDDYVDKAGNKAKGYTSLLAANFDDFMKKYQDKKMAYDPNIGNAGKTPETDQATEGDWKTKLEQEAQTIADALFGAFKVDPKEMISNIEHMFDHVPAPQVQLSTNAGTKVQAIEVFGLDEATNFEFAKIISRKCNSKFTTGNQIKCKGNRYCIEFLPNIDHDQSVLTGICAQTIKDFSRLTQNKVRYYLSANNTSSYQPLDFDRVASLSRVFRLNLVKVKTE